MCSGAGDWAFPQPGFPIRTSPDHSSVGSSPRLIAASYVLLRFLVPRHPPCALNNLTTKMKMLASTVQFSRYGRSPARADAGRAERGGPSRAGPVAGCEPARRMVARSDRTFRTQQRAVVLACPDRSSTPQGGCTSRFEPSSDPVNVPLR